MHTTIGPKRWPPFKRLIQASQRLWPELTPAERYGLVRSLTIYYGQPWKWRRLYSFYTPFLEPGALCFDIGAHVGNRSYFWQQQETQVIAIEPIPYLAQFLRELFAPNQQVTVLNCGVGDKPGWLDMHIDPRNPTISTLSTDWLQRMQDAPGWSSNQWQEGQKVPLITLQDLITDYGPPRFCKIDVEGMEAAVLKSLDLPLDALSFEIIPACRDFAEDCLAQLESLDDYVYNWSPGESLKMHFDRWQTSPQIRSFIDEMPPDGPSGDLFALRQAAMQDYPGLVRPR